MILSDRSLTALLPTLLQGSGEYFVNTADLINPASIDIRIGRTLKYENCHPAGPKWLDYDLVAQGSYLMDPKEVCLVATLEYFNVPNGYVLELKLKSTQAREGTNHALAFHIDPGFCGILTMEVVNELRYHQLPIVYGARFAQIVVHQTDQLSDHPYQGRYQGAIHVESAKDGYGENHG